MQPALTVKAIVPAGGYGGSSYGGGNSYGNNNNYGSNYGRSIEVPVSSVYTSSLKSYGAPVVDRQAIKLAKLSLYAPSAGSPLVWKEPDQVALKSYGPQQSYEQKQNYAEKAKGASAAAAAAAVAGKKQEYSGNRGYQQSSGY